MGVFLKYDGKEVFGTISGYHFEIEKCDWSIKQQIDIMKAWIPDSNKIRFDKFNRSRFDIGDVRWHQGNHSRHIKKDEIITALANYCIKKNNIPEKRSGEVRQIVSNNPYSVNKGWRGWNRIKSRFCSEGLESVDGFLWTIYCLQKTQKLAPKEVDFGEIRSYLSGKSQDSQKYSYMMKLMASHSDNEHIQDMLCQYFEKTILAMEPSIRKAHKTMTERMYGFVGCYNVKTHSDYNNPYIYPNARMAKTTFNHNIVWGFILMNKELDTLRFKYSETYQHKKNLNSFIHNFIMPEDANIKRIEVPASMDWSDKKRLEEVFKQKIYTY